MSKQHCKICLLYNRRIAAQNAVGKRRSSFFNKLLQQTEASLQVKARNYNLKAVHACCEQHLLDARKLFKYLRRIDVKKIQRRRDLIYETQEKIAKLRITLAKAIIENQDEKEKVVLINKISEQTRMLKQRERRLWEVS